MKRRRLADIALLVVLLPPLWLAAWLINREERRHRAT